MKKILSFATAVLLSLSWVSYGNSVAADKYRYGDFEYSILEDDSVLIDGYYGDGGYVEIPDIIDGKNVTKLAYYLFKGNETITEVVLPDTLKEICPGAFSNCYNLEKVNFPESLEIIGSSAFATCHSLKEIDLSHVKKIDECSFQLCISLEEIEVGGNIKTIPDHAFHGCGEVDTLIINEGVKVVQETAALNMYDLDAVVIPASVKEIGDHAFGYFYSYSEYTANTGLKIYGYKGTAAETYAVENGFEFVEILNYGDVNGDTFIDSSDASLVLGEYAKLSTGGKRDFSDEQEILADVDKSRTVDSVDASGILSYYAYASTGGTRSSAIYFFV